MPCLELSIPKITNEIKLTLNKKLTDAFTESTRFGPDIFGIRYNEYDREETSSGGKSWDGGNQKPYIHFVFFGPRLQYQEKQELVKTFSEAYITSIGKPHWQPVIYICELPYDNIGVEGQLLSDKDKEKADGKFYYDLPKND